MRFSFIKVVFFLSRRQPTCAENTVNRDVTCTHIAEIIEISSNLMLGVRLSRFFVEKSLELCGQKPADRKHFSAFLFLSFMRQSLSVCY